MNALPPLVPIGMRHPGSANSWRGRHRVPDRGSPLVRQLFEIINRERCTLREVAARSGVDSDTIANWRSRKNPSLFYFEAALGALGYRLTVVPKSDG